MHSCVLPTVWKDSNSTISLISISYILFIVSFYRVKSFNQQVVLATFAQQSMKLCWKLCTYIAFVQLNVLNNKTKDSECI